MNDESLQRKGGNIKQSATGFNHTLKEQLWKTGKITESAKSPRLNG